MHSLTSLIDPPALQAELDETGYALLLGLLPPEDCRALADLYGDEGLFRSRIVMARHGFGQGEYKYFAYPLPALLERLRQALYPRLAPIADRWNRELGVDLQYPATLDAFLARCHRAGAGSRRRRFPL